MPSFPDAHKHGAKDQLIQKGGPNRDALLTGLGHTWAVIPAAGRTCQVSHSGSALCLLFGADPGNKDFPEMLPSVKVKRKSCPWSPATPTLFAQTREVRREEGFAASPLNFSSTSVFSPDFKGPFFTAWNSRGAGLLVKLSTPKSMLVKYIL